MRAILASTALVGVIALSACSGSTSSGPEQSSDAASAAPSVEATAASAGPASTLPPLVAEPWVLPSPSSDADAQTIWCSALEQVVSSIANASSTRSGSQKQLNALATYSQLWTTATDRGYVTAEEADVNKTFLDGYQKLVIMQASGLTPDSPEVDTLTKEMNSLTTGSQPLFDSSAAKVTELCDFNASAAPSTGDSSSVATPSAAPSAS